MKRILSIILIISLLVASSTVVFALDIEKEIKEINLSITTESEALSFIESNMVNKLDSLSADDNNIKMRFLDIVENGNDVILSGDAEMSIFGKKYYFTFNEAAVDIVNVGDNRFYSGCIEVYLTDTVSALLDISVLDSFNKAIVNVTISDEKNNNEQVMLFGDTFGEQKALYSSELQSAKYNYGTPDEVVMIGTEEINTTSESGYGAYTLVDNEYSKKYAGNETNKQLVVMSVAKHDPEQAGSGYNGFELIRVFSRAYNVNYVEDNVSFAQPYKMHVEFQGDPNNLMSIVGTKPFKDMTNDNRGILEASFDICETIIGGVGASVISGVRSAITILNISLTDTISTSGVDATFDINVSDLSRFDMNYPSNEGSDEAHMNTENGVTFKVAYLQDIGSNTAEITVLSNITYRVYLLSDRTISRKTGDAVLTHTINLN